MAVIIGGILIVLFSVVAYEDFKNYAISWYIVLLVFIVSVLYALQIIDFKELFMNALINTGFIFLQLIGIFLFYSIKQKKMAYPIDSKLGVGDILILIVLGLLFSPVNYILFLLVSFLVTLIIFLVRTRLNNQKRNQQIPLAGYLGIYMNILILVRFINPEINYYNTDYLENLMIKML